MKNRYFLSTRASFIVHARHFINLLGYKKMTIPSKIVSKEQKYKMIVVIVYLCTKIPNLHFYNFVVFEMHH